MQSSGETGVFSDTHRAGTIELLCNMSSVLLQVVEPVPGAHSSSLPAALYRLLDPSANVDLPTAQRVRQQTMPMQCRSCSFCSLSCGWGAAVLSLHRSKPRSATALVLGYCTLQPCHRWPVELVMLLAAECVFGLETHRQPRTRHMAPQDSCIAQVCARGLDNRELDKLVGALGRSKATWRRALMLHEWLLGMGHTPDDRLCTTLMRVCAQHGQVRGPLAACQEFAGLCAGHPGAFATMVAWSSGFYGIPVPAGMLSTHRYFKQAATHT